MIFRTRTALLCIASVALALLSAALYAQENDAHIEVPAPHQTPVSGDTSADPDPAMHAVVNPESVSAAEAELLPQAKSVDLGEPVATQEATTAVAAPVVPPVSAAETPQAAKAEVETLPLVLLGTNVPPMTSARLSWSPAQSMEGLASPTPVLVVHGKTEGPTLCLTAAIHGDELNGIEIVRRVLYNIKPQSLRGSVIGVPIVNLQGFQRNSRYLPDRRDLNRYFPGYPKGSAAARMAYSFFHEIIKQCDVLVDLHTGSFDRTNLPQLRADLSKPEVAELTKGFGATVVLHGDGAVGSLRRAAVEFGIPAVTIEAGGPVRLQEDAIEHSVKSIHTLMYRMNMVKKSRSWGVPEPVYYSSQWVRANTGGILLSEVSLGERVDEGEVLGTITNPITNVRTEILAPLPGRVLGMAFNQLVMPGYAAYHLGISGEDQANVVVETENPSDETLDQSPDIAGSPELTDTAAAAGTEQAPDEIPEQD